MKVMKRIDLEHFKVCLINNHRLQERLDSLIKESFEAYCASKDITYEDKDMQMDDYQAAYELSLNYLCNESVSW